MHRAVAQAHRVVGMHDRQRVLAPVRVVAVRDSPRGRGRRGSPCARRRNRRWRARSERGWSARASPSGRSSRSSSGRSPDVGHRGGDLRSSSRSPRPASSRCGRRRRPPASPSASAAAARRSGWRRRRGAAGRSGRPPPRPRRGFSGRFGVPGSTTSPARIAAARPKTTRSIRLFDPSRLAPCTLAQPASPTAIRPGWMRSGFARSGAAPRPSSWSGCRPCCSARSAAPGSAPWSRRRRRRSWRSR